VGRTIVRNLRTRWLLSVRFLEQSSGENIWISVAGSNRRMEELHI